jgi:LPS sulfotransferase NodH
MTGDFDYFVILGDMRTGSNLLEESLDAYAGLVCHGEVFNPRFMGHADQVSLFGVTMAERDRDPLALIARLMERSDGLAGFRLFPDHDQRVLAHCLGSRRCAKIVLARNPVDSYVSLKIARQTGQWWLGDLTSAKSARIRFDAVEFDRFLGRVREFYGHIRHALQVSGQTAFHLHYDDLSDPSVIDGLALWLGAAGPADPGRRKARVQNPEPLERKVENVEEMAEALSRADVFDIYRIPDFEPRRGPNVPGWMTSDTLRLLYMPLAGGPTERVERWMQMAGGAPVRSGATQKDIRRWKRETAGHRSFTVVAHPLRRAHAVFCEKILMSEPEAFLEIRRLLIDRYGVPIPETGPDAAYTSAQHRAAFLGFLRFLKGNLSGQTSVRVPAAWSSQAGLVRSLSEVAAPDVICREDTLVRDLAPFVPETTPFAQAREQVPVPLSDIYDAEIEEACRAAYMRDYTAFGFAPWA